MGEPENAIADFSLCSAFYEGESPVGLLPQLTLGISRVSKGCSFHMVPCLGPTSRGGLIRDHGG